MSEEVYLNEQKDLSIIKYSGGIKIGRRFQISIKNEFVSLTNAEFKELIDSGRKLYAPPVIKTDLEDHEIAEAIRNYEASGFYLSKKFHKEYGRAALRNYGNKYA